MSIEKVDNLENSIDGEITLRGFLYTDENGVQWLAQEPNLKSCCVGKKGVQVEILPSIEPTLNVVALRGVLRKQEHWVLQDSKLESKPSIGIGLLILLGVYLGYKKYRYGKFFKKADGKTGGR